MVALRAVAAQRVLPWSLISPRYAKEKTGNRWKGRGGGGDVGDETLGGGLSRPWSSRGASFGGMGIRHGQVRLKAGGEQGPVPSLKRKRGGRGGARSGGWRWRPDGVQMAASKLQNRGVRAKRGRWCQQWRPRWRPQQGAAPELSGGGGGAGWTAWSWRWVADLCTVLPGAVSAASLSERVRRRLGKREGVTGERVVGGRRGEGRPGGRARPQGHLRTRTPPAWSRPRRVTGGQTSGQAGGPADGRPGVACPRVRLPPHRPERLRGLKCRPPASRREGGGAGSRTRGPPSLLAAPSGGPGVLPPSLRPLLLRIIGLSRSSGCIPPSTPSTSG